MSDLNKISMPVMMTYPSDANLAEPTIFSGYRKELREKLMAESVLSGGWTDDSQEPTLEFSGSGDSGEANNSFDDEHLQHFMTFLLDNKVEIDWYNNEGGGGKIAWNLPDDEITIDTYYNVHEEHSYPSIIIDANNVQTEIDPEECLASKLLGTGYET